MFDVTVVVVVVSIPILNNFRFADKPSHERFITCMHIIIISVHEHFLVKIHVAINYVPEDYSIPGFQ